MSILQIFKETKWNQLTILVDYIQNLSALKLNITNKGKIAVNIAIPLGSNFDWKNAMRIDLDFLEISKLVLVLEKLLNLILSNKITSANKNMAISSLLSKIFNGKQQDTNDRVFTHIFHLYNGNISNLNFIKPTDTNKKNIGTLFSFQIYKKRNGISSTSGYYPVNTDRALLLYETLKSFQKDMIILNHFDITNNKSEIPISNINISSKDNNTSTMDILLNNINTNEPF